MKIRLAVPEEAEECWNIRNLSIREGCKPSYCASVLEAWTPEAMPEHYRAVITEILFLLSSCLMQDWWRRGIWILPKVA